MFIFAFLHIGYYVACASILNGDFDRAARNFRVQAIFITFDAAMFSVIIVVALTKFLNMIDGAIDTANSLQSSQQSTFIAELRDVSRRFRTLRIVLFITAAISSLVFLLNCVFLPMFWWLQLIHLTSAAVCTILILFAFTVPQKRAAAMRILSCGLIKVEATKSKALSTSSDPERRAVAPGQVVGSHGTQMPNTDVARPSTVAESEQ